MNKKGFTLIELMIVIAIMGIIGTIIVPNFTKRGARYEREAFISKLNALVQLGWQQALTTNRLHKIECNFEKKIIYLQVLSDQAQEGKEVFVPVTGAYLDTQITIPDQIIIKQFFIEGHDELSRYAGRKTAESWFFILPNGTTQEVIINMIDTKDMRGEKARQIGLILNPFSAEFKTYDEYQKP